MTDRAVGVALMCALAMCGTLAARAAEGAHVKIGGCIGEKFETSIRGNVLKLDLENDFFRPFVERKGRSSGFVGLGKHADAAVHYAWNTKDPAVIAHKEKVIDFIVKNQLPDGYTGFYCPEDRLAKSWDIHEMGFIVQALVSDWELFGNRSALEAAKKNVWYVIDRWKTLPDNWEISTLTDREITLGFGYCVARLYAATKDERLRDFLRNERALDDWNDPDKLLDWKRKRHGQSVVMIDGARRVGKSWIAEEFARNEYEAYLLGPTGTVPRRIRGMSVSKGRRYPCRIAWLSLPGR